MTPVKGNALGWRVKKIHCITVMGRKMIPVGGCWNHLKACGMCLGHSLAVSEPVLLQDGGDNCQLAPQPPRRTR